MVLRLGVSVVISVSNSLDSVMSDDVTLSTSPLVMEP